MSFADAVAAQLSASGINVDPTGIPDRDAFLADLDSIGTWLESLDVDTREAIDELVAENPIKSAISDPDVGIAQSIGPVLAAFDATEAAFSISTILDTLRAASDAAPT